MKKQISIITIMAASLILTACGGSGGGSAASGYTGAGATAANNSSTTPGATAGTVSSKAVPLKIGEATPVDAGYSIVDSSDDAVIDILVVGESKTVTLVAGAASLLLP